MLTEPCTARSYWPQPAGSADAFTHAAARCGVTIAAGSTSCIDGHHQRFARLSFTEQPGTLDLAVERLAAAWETHAENIAAGPART
jgi:DNA-binding transcriptional MocR family regulator